MSGVLISAEQTRELQGMRSDLDRLADAIRNAPAAHVREGLDRVKLAREWAKIRKLTEEMRRDLLWLEAVCLRRLAQLDALEQIPAYHRPAARHFALLSDADLSALLDAASKASTAAGAFAQWKRGDDERTEARRTIRWANGEDRTFHHEDPKVDTYALLHAQDVRGAIAVVMEDAIGRGAFTVDDVVEQVLTDELPSWHGDKGVREGIAEVVRRAIRSAPVIALDDSIDLPRFITCQHPNGYWLRVPIERATVGQFQEMVALRQQQLRLDAAALEELEQVGALYDVDARPRDSFMLPNAFRASDRQAS